MYDLGIYYDLYGDAPMTFGRALLIAAVGFMLVFAILGVIAVFVRLIGRAFDAKSKSPAGPQRVSVGAAQAKEGSAPPENKSSGTLTLIDVSEEEAALIMAIVSDKSGIPLSRLHFKTIKLLEEDK